MFILTRWSLPKPETENTWVGLNRKQGTRGLALDGSQRQNIGDKNNIFFQNILWDFLFKRQSLLTKV